MRYIWVILAVLMALFNLSSCFSDDDQEVVTSSDCIVTSAIMGTLNRYLPTKTDDGRDSTYVVTVVGSLYPLHIDHYRGLIYNTDSLPKGTDLSKVAFSTFNASSSMTVRSIYSGQDTTFVTTDSLDCTTSRMITVYSTDGTSQRSYTLRICAHQEEGDSMRWVQTTNYAEAFAGVNDMRALAVDNRLYVLCDEAGQSYMLCAVIDEVNGEADATPWQRVALAHTLRVASFVRFAGAFYALTTDDVLMTSTDGEQWTAVETDFRAQYLVLAGSTQLIAYADGAFYSSTDAVNWVADVADEPQYLPNGYVVGTSIQQKNNPTFETFVVVGVRDGQPCVWRKEIDLTGVREFPWVYLPATLGSGLNVPDVKHFSLHYYDGGTLFAGVDNAGKFRPLAMSYDNGRTWKSDVLTTPDVQPTGCYATTVDSNNYIWLLGAPSGETWKGRINRLGWKSAQDVFNKTNKK